MVRTKADESLITQQQTEIARLREILDDEFPDSPVSYRPALSGRFVNLQKDCTVRFQLGNADVNYVDVSLRGSRLDVRGGYTINICPEAANSISVGVRGQ